MKCLRMVGCDRNDVLLDSFKNNGGLLKPAAFHSLDQIKSDGSQSKRIVEPRDSVELSEYDPSTIPGGFVPSTHPNTSIRFPSFLP